MFVLTHGLPGSHATDQAAAYGGPAVGRPAKPVTTTPDPTVQAARAILATPAAPVRLVVPSIGIDAMVESVGTDAQGRMGVPSSPSHVAWYSPGPVPGDVGDAVIDGHLDWTNGPAVFWNLGKLHKGDQVIVMRADQSQATFVVDSTRTYPFDARATDLFSQSGPPSLSLVTCSGSWDRARGTYLTRLAVHASLVAAPVQQTPGDEGG